MVACCAATKALVVLMVMSRSKPSNGIANGSSGGEGVHEEAMSSQQLFAQGHLVPRPTIVNDYGWNA